MAHGSIAPGVARLAAYWSWHADLGPTTSVELARSAIVQAFSPKCNIARHCRLARHAIELRWEPKFTRLPPILKHLQSPERLGSHTTLRIRLDKSEGLREAPLNVVGLELVSRSWPS